MVPILHRFRCPAITTAAAAKVEVDSRAVMSMGLCKVFDTLSNGDSFGLVGTFYKEKVLIGAGHCENHVDTFICSVVEIWEISGPQSGETRSQTGKCDGKCDRI